MSNITCGDYIFCVIMTIGVDLIYSLFTYSGETAWNLPALKRIFTAVAKRALSPVGITIAVVSFGICIGRLKGYIGNNIISYIIVVSIALVGVIKNGADAIFSIRKKDYFSLKVALFFIFIILIIAIGVIWLIKRR